MAHEQVWSAQTALVLASRSKIRRELLQAAGIHPEIIAADVNEREIENDYLTRGSPVENLASALAQAKAEAVSAERPESYCLGADQVLLVDGRVMHKPGSLAEAAESIASLSGRTHCLISAFCIVRSRRAISADADRAFLTMRPLGRGAITRYLDLAGSAVTTSVGAYQFEGLGRHLFERVEGDCSTIQGLPMLKLLAALRGAGLVSL